MSSTPPGGTPTGGGPTNSWILNVIIGGGLGGIGFAIAMAVVEKIRGRKRPPELEV